MIRCRTYLILATVLGCSIMLCSACASNEVHTDLVNNTGTTDVHTKENNDYVPNSSEGNSVSDALLKTYYGYSCSQMDVDREGIYLEKLSYLCAQELWADSNAYDAGHGMMIPMHYAFKSRNNNAIECYDMLFKSFVDDYESGGGYSDFEDYSLRKAHFMYLGTQYLVLSIANRGVLEDWQKEMYSLIERYSLCYLYDSVAIYGVEDKDYIKIENVLNGKKYKKRYYSAIADAELFNLAILCDCCTIDRCESLSLYSEELQTASEYMFEIMTNENLNLETADGGWVFQPGIYSDYKDFLYAGHKKLQLGLEENRVDDIAWDSSHFHRFPAFITSAIVSQSDKGKSEKLIYRLDTLANQMVNKVLRKEGKYWFVTTFMDGRNGLYCYNPETGDGYEGYDLSSTLFAGWWSLLRDDRITAIYNDLDKLLPLNNDENNPYLGLDTKESQNPYLVGNSAWDNGWFECIVWCAEKM